jgi:hypothetical protein
VAIVRRGGAVGGPASGAVDMWEGIYVDWKVIVLDWRKVSE